MEVLYSPHQRTAVATAFWVFHVIAGLVRRNEKFRIARLLFDLSDSKELLAYGSSFCRKPTHRNYPW